MEGLTSQCGGDPRRFKIKALTDVEISRVSHHATSEHPLNQSSRSWTLKGKQTEVG